MVRRLLEPSPALVAAFGAIGLAILYIDHGWDVPALVVAASAVLIGALFGIGRLLFSRWPYYAGFLLEAGLGLLTLAAAVAGAVLLWLAIDKAPGDMATTREKQVWAALIAAVTAYLGAVIIKPEGTKWNPVKTAIARSFGKHFMARSDKVEADARDAVQEEGYGAQAPAHAAQTISGWGWDARRLRTRHIQDQLARAGSNQSR